MAGNGKKIQATQSTKHLFLGFADTANRRTGNLRRLRTVLLADPQRQQRELLSASVATGADVALVGNHGDAEFRSHMRVFVQKFRSGRGGRPNLGRTFLNHPR